MVARNKTLAPRLESLEEREQWETSRVVASAERWQFRTKWLRGTSHVRDASYGVRSAWLWAWDAVAGCELSLRCELRGPINVVSGMGRWHLGGSGHHLWDVNWLRGERRVVTDRERWHWGASGRRVWGVNWLQGLSRVATSEGC